MIHDLFWAVGLVTCVSVAIAGLWFGVVGAVHQLTRRN